MKVSMTKVKAYILANITGYEGALEGKADSEKVKGLLDAFYSEYSFRIEQVGLQRLSVTGYRACRLLLILIILTLVLNPLLSTEE